MKFGDRRLAEIMTSVFKRLPSEAVRTVKPECVLVGMATETAAYDRTRDVTIEAVGRQGGAGQDTHRTVPDRASQPTLRVNLCLRLVGALGPPPCTWRAALHTGAVRTVRAAGSGSPRGSL